MIVSNSETLAICAWCKRDTDFTLAHLPRACNHCGVMLAQPLVGIKIVDQESS